MIRIYSKMTGSEMGEVRDAGRGMVSIHLDAKWWPEVRRDDKEGLQYMGEFHSFESFKLTGTFGDLQTCAGRQPTIGHFGAIEF